MRLASFLVAAFLAASTAAFAAPPPKLGQTHADLDYKAGDPAGTAIVKFIERLSKERGAKP